MVIMLHSELNEWQTLHLNGLVNKDSCYYIGIADGSMSDVSWHSSDWTPNSRRPHPWIGESQTAAAAVTRSMHQITPRPTGS